MNAKERVLAFLKEKIETTVQWLEEQEWYRELIEKWNNLDHQKRNTVKLVTIGFFALSLAWFTLSSVLSVYQTKHDMELKLDLLGKIQSASQELGALKGDYRGASSAAPPSWDSFIQDKAIQAGIDSTRMKVTPVVANEEPKETDKKKKESQEATITQSNFQIAVQQVNIKQLVRFAFALENSSEPVKVRTLSVDTEGSDGYLKATLWVTSYAMKTEGKDEP